MDIKMHSDMTPPLTDAELLAYIERTKELKEWCVRHIGSWDWTVGEKIIVQTEAAEMARAFHAREQRVREEAAVAVWIDAMDYCRKIGISPSHKGELFRACKVIRALNKSTAPQLSTANVSTAPSPEGAGQGEAAEVVGLLAEADALEVELRSEPFNASGFLTRAAIKDLRRRARAILTKQGGK